MKLTWTRKLTLTQEDDTTWSTLIGQSTLTVKNVGDKWSAQWLGITSADCDDPESALLDFEKQMIAWAMAAQMFMGMVQR